MNSKFILNTIPSPDKELFNQFYSKLITRDDFIHSRTESTFNNKTKKFEFTFTGFSELYMINSDLLNLTKNAIMHFFGVNMILYLSTSGGLKI